MKDKFLSFLGLCKKSGNVLEGYNKCEANIGFRKINLIILSLDVSENTKEKFKKLASENNTKLIEAYNKEELGFAIGLDEINVIGITNLGFSKKLVELWNELDRIEKE